MRLAAGGAQTGANIAGAAPKSGSATPLPKRKGSRPLARKARARKPKRSALALVAAAGAGSAGQVRSKERRLACHLPPAFVSGREKNALLLASTLRRCPLSA